MKKSRFIGLVLFFAVGLACSKGTTDIKNIPIKEYRLQEELSIHTEPNDQYMLVTPRIVKADDKGNIFVLDGKALQVCVFDARGTFLKCLGKKGIGPHEVLLASEMVVDRNSNIHLLDSKLKKIVRIHFDGTADNDLRFPASMPDFFWVTHDGYYLIKQTTTASNGDNMARIVKYDATGKQILQSREFIERIPHHETANGTDGKRVTMTAISPFDPQGYFVLGSNGNIYYGYSDKYQITLLNPVFNESIVVNRTDGERFKVSTEKKEEYLQFMKRKAAKRGFVFNKLSIPEYDKFFYDMWTDNQQRIFVLLPTNESKVNLDVYDLSGRYLEKMVIHPLTDGIDTTSVFSSPHFKNNAIYAIVYNEEGEYFIKRYRLILSPAKP